MSLISPRRPTGGKGGRKPPTEGGDGSEGMYRMYMTGDRIPLSPLGCTGDGASM